MWHNRPWEERWYDGDGEELNPFLNNLHHTNRIGSLENIVDSISADNNYPANNNSGLLGYTRHLVSNLHFHIPTPIKVGFAIGLLSLVTAFSSGSAPTTPTHSPINTCMVCVFSTWTPQILKGL